jgi:hypothetical protein
MRFEITERQLDLHALCVDRDDPRGTRIDQRRRGDKDLTCSPFSGPV